MSISHKTIHFGPALKSTGPKYLIRSQKYPTSPPSYPPNCAGYTNFALAIVFLTH